MFEGINGLIIFIGVLFLLGYFFDKNTILGKIARLLNTVWKIGAVTLLLEALLGALGMGSIFDLFFS